MFIICVDRTSFHFRDGNRRPPRPLCRVDSPILGRDGVLCLFGRKDDPVTGRYTRMHLTGQITRDVKRSGHFTLKISQNTPNAYGSFEIRGTDLHSVVNHVPPKKRL